MSEKIDVDRACLDAVWMLNDAEDRLKRGCDKYNTSKYEDRRNLARHNLALVEALEKYGQHQIGCIVNQYGVDHARVKCNCEWDEAARALLPTKSEGEENVPESAHS